MSGLDLTTPPPPQIFANDLQLVRTKVKSMIRDGKEKLKIVTDFDHTLSTAKCFSSWCALEKCEFVSETYRTTCHELAEFYYPKANDPNSTEVEKFHWMKEWADKACGLLVQERISRDIYHRVLELSQTAIQFREGCGDLFALSHQLQVPMYVFSAGIGDTIDSAIIHHFNQFYTPLNPHYPVHMIPPSSPWYEESQTSQSLPPIHYQSILPRAICGEVHYETHPESSPEEFGVVQGLPRSIFVLANHLEFSRADSNTIVNHCDASTFQISDYLSGFRTDCDHIHVCNKGEEFLVSAPYYKTKVKPRHNAFVCGDSLGDAIMIRNTTDNVVRLGFLNQTRSTTLATHLNCYLDAFDVVFVDNDCGIAFMNQVLLFIQNHTNAPSDDEIESFLDSLLSSIQLHTRQ